MLQTMSTKSQKIPKKSKLLLEFPIRLHYKDLNQNVLLKVDTGSDINCISLGTFQRLFPNKQLNRLHYKDPNQNVLLKVDTGSDINCISLGTSQRLFPNTQLNRSTLLLENYGDSPVSIIVRFIEFIRWKGVLSRISCHKC